MMGISTELTAESDSFAQMVQKSLKKTALFKNSLRVVDDRGVMIIM